MNNLTILALDISSTSIGVCYNGEILDTIKLPHKEDIAVRCRVAAAMIRGQLFLTPDVDLVAIEAPFIHPKHPNSVIPQARVSGAVLLVLSEKQLAWREFEPTVIKRALTGKGNASKAEMIEQAGWADCRAKIAKAPDEHQADAYALWLAARALKVEKVAA